LTEHVFINGGELLTNCRSYSTVPPSLPAHWDAPPATQNSFSLLFVCSHCELFSYASFFSIVVRTTLIMLVTFVVLFYSR